MLVSEQARELWRQGRLGQAVEIAEAATDTLQRLSDPDSRAELLRCRSILGHLRVGLGDVAAALFEFGAFANEVDDVHPREDLRRAYAENNRALADIYRDRFPELADRFLNVDRSEPNPEVPPARTADDFAFNATAWLILAGRTTQVSWNPYGYFGGIGRQGDQHFEYRPVFKRVKNGSAAQQRDAAIAAWDASTPPKSRLELKVRGELPASSDGRCAAVNCVVLAPRYDTYGSVVFAREGCVALVRHQEGLFVWQVVRHDASPQRASHDEWWVHVYSWPGRLRRASCRVPTPDDWAAPVGLRVTADGVLALDWTSGSGTGHAGVEWDPGTGTLTPAAAAMAPPAIGVGDLSVRPHGTTAASHEGRFAVPGHDLVALYLSSSGRPVLVPPNAVAIAVGDAEIFSWRVEKRSGASGVARDDYDWILEVYAWPGRELVSSHRLRSRNVIAGCWPDRLEVPAAYGGRLVTFTGRYEDGTTKVYVVRHRDGSYEEMLEQAAAVAATAR